MSTPFIFNSLLLLHLIGLILFAGTTVADFFTTNQFWKQYAEDATKAKPILQTLARSPLLMRIGIILIILTGIGMMGLTHGVFGEQLWFRIKFGIVLVLIANYLVMGIRLLTRLQKVYDIPAASTNKLRTSLKWFQSAQLLLLFAIVLLSVFKFN